MHHDFCKLFIVEDATGLWHVLFRALVYDSLHTSIDKETLALLKQILGANIRIELGNRPKQNGTADRGIFAIATCVSIAN